MLADAVRGMSGDEGMISRTRVLVVDPSAPDPAAVAEAAAVIREGGLVAFPTETVYGLGANALDARAVAGIFAAKGRPASDPLIVHVASVADVGSVAAVWPAEAQMLAERFWPGPLTLILPRHDAVPLDVTAGLETVGVRVPAHPVALALLRAAGCPIAAPSANRFSQPSPTRAPHVLADLDGRIDLVLDGGPTAIGVESTILDLTVQPPLVRRFGGVPVEELRGIVPDVQVMEHYASTADVQSAPGQLLRHYAPRATLTLYEGQPDAIVERFAREARDAAARGRRIGILAPAEDVAALAPLIAGQAAAGRVISMAFGARRDPARAAHELFDRLRRLDDAGVEEILAAGVEEVHIGRAIRDRLVRAAEGRVRRV